MWQQRASVWSCTAVVFICFFPSHVAATATAGAFRAPVKPSTVLIIWITARLIFPFLNPKRPHTVNNYMTSWIQTTNSRMSVLLFRALLWVSAGHPRSDFGLDSRSRRPEYQSCPVKCPVMGFPSAAHSRVNTRRNICWRNFALRYKRSTAFNSLLWGPHCGDK